MVEYKEHFHKGMSFDELLSFGLKNKDYLTEDDFAQSDLNFYKIPPLEDLKKTGILGEHYFSYYHKWNPQENFYYSAENTGYRANPERSEGTYSKYASLDDKMDGFHFYMRYIKFGLGRCAEDASHEIRDGHISREEGIALMKKYEGELPNKKIDKVINQIWIKKEREKSRFCSKTDKINKINHAIWTRKWATCIDVILLYLGYCRRNNGIFFLS